MLKRRATQVSIAVGTGLCVVTIAAFSPFGLRNLFQMGVPGGQNALNSLKSEGSQDSLAAVLELEPEQRAVTLETIANSLGSPDRFRARYLLASDLILQAQGRHALTWLKDLEKDYPALAPYILVKRATAYEIAGDSAKAEASWKEVLSRYPQDPAAAEALYALGRNLPQYWDQAIAQFPTHPRAVDIAQTRLKKNPKQLPLLLIVAKSGLYETNYLAVLDRLTSNYAQQLTPQDWAAIAFGYWEKQDYGKAGAAYAHAPRTPLNAYRMARGLQLGERGGAYEAYQRMVKEFPKARETSLALIRLSRLAEPNTAIGYLNQIVQHFPDRAAEALLAKAKLLDGQSSQKTAAKIRQQLLQKYADADATAELRWNVAWQKAKSGDLKTAVQWAQPIPTANPNSPLAAEAGFWVGKWSQQLQQENDARKAYTQVIRQYPNSYYAWRSAVYLGWEVGDFHNLRQLNPQVNRAVIRQPLPVGSAALQELYKLGQGRDAWRLWQTEFQNRVQPTVAEQYTDGLMRLGIGDNLDGIFMLDFLSQREIPQERTEYQALKRQLSYWYALYPFPFLNPIETWSQQRQLNPILVTALIRQESRFMPGIRSAVGATGLMQVMPDTAAEIASKINLKQYKLNDPEDNIKLGTWYLDHTHQEYSNNSLLAVASYNAGPGAVADWLQKGVRDPDEFVEAIPYDETKGYVKAVFENYWNYLRLYNPQISQQVAGYAADHPTAFKWGL
ncbi:MAG: transglycosylase SLT domain-containing protein [Scytolyngbya sp. HA4215-MV1]|jgi:soluble lytic murein transglycosylase|nr:transglycosylase SLT domain-containing protein [Scytolyngbya sp. HA4215-MV1]